MNNESSMWRTELWHPLMVHLPVTTLLLASVAGLLYYLMVKPGHKQFIKLFTMVLLFIGVTTGWGGIYTGQLAYNIEVRKICDPKVLQEHQWWSYFTVIIFTVILALKIAGKWLSPRINHVLAIICLPLYIAGLAGIMYAGHLGAEVVYNQGAAVHKPKDDCSDYIIK